VGERDRERERERERARERERETYLLKLSVFQKNSRPKPPEQISRLGTREEKT
jgi:hypothetical protein